VATKSGSSYKVYIDGIDRTFALTNQTLVNTASALILGAKGGTSEFLAAIIDEAAIYNTVLSAATVADHYQSGKGS
jgi:hypothetical protein